MRKIKYQNWIYEILPEASPRLSPVGEGGVSLVEPEIEQEVRQAVAKLSLKGKVFIEQFYFEGKSYKEIGQILNLNLKQVEYLHRKAVFNLKSLLADFVARKYKIEVSPINYSKVAQNCKTARGCLICQNPKQIEIEKVIASKKEHQTWRVVLKKLKQRFNLEINAPQILIGHMKHKS